MQHGNMNVKLMQFVKLHDLWARNFEIRVKISFREFIFYNGSLQCNVLCLETALKQITTCMLTLTQCSISFPSPPLFVTFYKQVSVFFILEEYKDGEVGGMWNTECLWGSDRDGTGHGERTNLFYVAYLEINVTRNKQHQINNVLSQQTGKLSSKLS